MTAFLRKAIALFLSAFTFFSLIFSGTPVSPWTNNAQTAAVNDISGDSGLSDSVKLAAKLGDGVQCVYANAGRTAYKMTNLNAVLTHTLDKYKNGATLTNLDLVLLPWGIGFETDCENVRQVREDSAIHRLRADAEVGTVENDPVIPTVKCENNEAVFTVTGGKNNSVVKIDGFTKFGKLIVEEKIDGQWKALPLASDCGYDGYDVQYQADGTYCYSFVFDSDGTRRTFRTTVA